MHESASPGASALGSLASEVQPWKGKPTGDGSRLEDGRAMSLEGSTPSPSAFVGRRAEPRTQRVLERSKGSCNNNLVKLTLPDLPVSVTTAGCMMQLSSNGCET